MNTQNTTHNLIDTFYTAFQNLDAKAMIACYYDDIKFTDPAFGSLIGTDAKAMWQMLIDSQKGKDFKIYFDSVFSDKHTGTAHWEAKYVFSKTGRFVHNKIDAQFKFKDHLIVEHQDYFNLHHWAQ